MENERKTIVTFRGDGVQTTFAFPMDYLKKPYIKVKVDGTELTYGTDYTVNSKQVDFVVAPGLDLVVVIYRETSTDRLVAWEDASVLKASDMSISQVQQLHLAEETSDKVQESGLALDELDGIWDARYNRIKNVNDPVDTLDVVNKRYLDLYKGTLADNIAAMTAAKLSETNSKTSEVNSKASELAAKASELAAKASELAAKASETNAKASEDIVVPLVPTVNQAAQDAATASAQAAQAAADANTALEGVKSLGAVPVGMLVPFLTENVPPGYLLLSGTNRVSSYDAALYPDLYAHLGTTTLPDCTNRFPEGAGDHIAGGAVKAWRLPAFSTNTTGAHVHSFGSYNQAFNVVTSTSPTVFPGTGPTSNSGNTGSAGAHTHTLDVPADNTDTYLAPDAFGVYWAIKAYGALSNEGTAEAAKLIADVANINPNTFGRNKIINGNFDIWQRGVSQTTNGYGSDDRWSNSHIGSTKTHSRQAFTVGQTEVPGNPKYFSRTVVSSVVGASNYCVKLQRVEDVTLLAGKTITLSFWAKADANKNITVEFYQNFGTGGSSNLSAGSFTIPLITSWERYTITTTLPSVFGKTIGDNNETEVLFYFDAGSNFAARSNSLGQQSGTFDIAQVQLEEGSVATPFEQRFIGLELQMCQRYYEVGDMFVSTYWASTTSSLIGTCPYKVQKRANPTQKIISTNSLLNVSDIVVYNNFTTSFGVNISASSTGITRAYVNFSADAEL